MEEVVVGKNNTGHKIKTKDDLPVRVKSGNTAEGKAILKRDASQTDEGFSSRPPSLSSEAETPLNDYDSSILPRKGSVSSDDEGYGSEPKYQDALPVFGDGEASVSPSDWAQSVLNYYFPTEDDDVFELFDNQDITDESSISSSDQMVSETTSENPEYVQEATAETRTSVSLAPDQLVVTTGDTIALNGGVAKADSGPVLRSTEITVDPNASKKARAKKLATEIKEEVAKRLERSIGAGTADAEYVKDILDVLPKELHRPIRRAVLKKKIATAFSSFFSKLMAPKRAIVAVFSAVVRQFNDLVNKYMSTGMSEEEASGKAADTVTANFESPSALIASLEKQGYKAEAEVLVDALTLDTNKKLHQHMGRTLDEMLHITTQYKYPALSMLSEPEKKFLVEASLVAAGIASGRVRPNGDLRISHKTGEDAFCTMEKVDHAMNILSAPTLREVIQKLSTSPELSGLSYSKHLPGDGNRVEGDSSGDEVSLEGVNMFDDGQGFTTSEAAPKVRTAKGVFEDVRSQLSTRLNLAKEGSSSIGIDFILDSVMVNAGAADFNDELFSDTASGITYRNHYDREVARALKKSLKYMVPDRADVQLEEVVNKLLTSRRMEPYKESLREQWDKIKDQVKEIKIENDQVRQEWALWEDFDMNGKIKPD
ncbi:MAG: hypothetical protein ACR2PT_17505 [Endozoicomonas sp.]